ncbi:Ribosomal RNA small subunit methyltransferase C [Actinomyces bovis]|uniref:Ribosomal RNA small subunit methyltransferase C n=1 Tax=Actinomyces bovis TaxID=1658 RepID=A0ABY1VS95_9ACTO|nr:methyltransferase [Actinomyces bovis]SPT53908.1 Ribosomal RNA small subunit methyltransferase C [Actinomyces bovis]VEG53362.1 Ribosomal RNA small subunit methyltransferase C [Actinomyces israelii]
MSEQHYFTASPATEAAERQHVFTIRGREFKVTTASGVFSSDRLDKGTQVLLDQVPEPPTRGTFLDLGCGWGPITLALADAAPAATVLAADVNERALDLTARNAVAHGYTNVRAVPAEALRSELQANDTRLDLIWSNPPVRIGKEALHELLLSWLPLLAADGEAWLVVGKNLGADSLAKWLGEQGFEVQKAASSKGFRVLRVLNPDQ